MGKVNVPDQSWSTSRRLTVALLFPWEYGSKIYEGRIRHKEKELNTMLDTEEGAQLLGCDRDLLEPAETKVALGIVWSLTFSSL